MKRSLAAIALASAIFTPLAACAQETQAPAPARTASVEGAMQSSRSCNWGAGSVANDSVVMRAAFQAANTVGVVDFADLSMRRVVSADCREGQLSLGFYTQSLEERSRLILDNGAYVTTIEQLPGNANKQLISDFITGFSASLENGTRFQPAFYFEVDEVRSNISGTGQTYFLGLVDPNRGMVSLAQVILNDAGGVHSVTLSGAGNAYNFCYARRDGIPNSTADGVFSCQSGTLLAEVGVARSPS